MSLGRAESWQLTGAAIVTTCATAWFPHILMPSRNQFNFQEPITPWPIAVSDPRKPFCCPLLLIRKLAGSEHNRIRLAETDLIGRRGA